MISRFLTKLLEINERAFGKVKRRRMWRIYDTSRTHTCVIDTELRGDPLRYLRAMYDRELNTRSHAHPFTQIRRGRFLPAIRARSIVIKFRDGVCIVSVRQHTTAAME